MKEMQHKPYKTIQVAEDVFIDVCNSKEFRHKGKQLTTGIVFVLRWETTDDAEKPNPIRINMTENTFKKLLSVNLDIDMVETLYK